MFIIPFLSLLLSFIADSLLIAGGRMTGSASSSRSRAALGVVCFGLGGAARSFEMLGDIICLLLPVPSLLLSFTAESSFILDGRMPGSASRFTYKPGVVC